MPILDLGYRGHDRETSPGWNTNRWTRWMTIASTGIRLVWRGTWLRRTLFVTAIPSIIVAILFFALEQLPPDARRQVITSQLILAGMIDEAMADRVNLADYPNHDVWALIISNYFRYTQSLAMVLLVGIVAPRLISFDYRSKGYLLYFSRPIGVFQYLLGKQAVVWFYISLLTTFPALASYVLGVLVSPSLSVVGETIDLPFRILGASVLLILPTTMVALVLSAITEESRYSAFGWIAIWVIGWVSYAMISATYMSATQSSSPPDWCTFLSPYHTLGRVQRWIFGVQDFDQTTAICLVIVTVVFAVSYIVSYRKLVKQLQV